MSTIIPRRFNRTITTVSGLLAIIVVSVIPGQSLHNVARPLTKLGRALTCIMATLLRTLCRWRCHIQLEVLMNCPSRLMVSILYHYSHKFDYT